jgi:hypothetical protein
MGDDDREQFVEQIEPLETIALPPVSRYGPVSVRLHFISVPVSLKPSLHPAAERHVITLAQDFRLFGRFTNFEQEFTSQIAVQAVILLLRRHELLLCVAPIQHIFNRIPSTFQVLAVSRSIFRQGSTNARFAPNLSLWRTY